MVAAMACAISVPTAVWAMASANALLRAFLEAPLFRRGLQFAAALPPAFGTARSPSHTQELKAVLANTRVATKSSLHLIDHGRGAEMWRILFRDDHCSHDYTLQTETAMTITHHLQALQDQFSFASV